LKVAVLGLWHLGCVTAACTAAAGHDVVAFDPDRTTIEGLGRGLPPISEPGLADLIASASAAGRLRFTGNVEDATRGADVVWVTFDTPVDNEDRADTAFVLRQVEAAFPYLADGALVLSSSQLPVGSIRKLEQEWSAGAAGRTVRFAVSPENLRLGQAIDVFTKPDRVIVGVRDARAREIVTDVLRPITARIEWMGVESAEMTKHAVNAFLAASVTFINELAVLCEETGADAKEVERGLKSERRIGPAAYLSPGAAFAGGTLARDVVFLRDLGRQLSRETPMMDGIARSNAAHRAWAARRLVEELGTVAGKRVAVWGLTYKPGTDTLRRSAAIELCEWLLREGAQVIVHDPAAGDLPAALAAIERAPSAIDAAHGADALVIATEWPDYRKVAAAAVIAAVRNPLVVDANRFLGNTLGSDARIRLVSVGQPRA
jgi:UDPglucose 6-dehydrogenase